MTKGKNILGAFLAFIIFSGSGTAKDLFKGIESGDNFLDKSIQAVENDAQRLGIRFSDQEAKGLHNIVSEVDLLLAKGQDENLLNTDLSKRLLSLEKEWRKREGAWVVVRLLEAIRLKFQLYLQNLYFLKRIAGRHPGMEEATRARIERYRQGIEVSNRKLEATVENASR